MLILQSFDLNELNEISTTFAFALLFLVMISSFCAHFYLPCLGECDEQKRRACVCVCVSSSFASCQNLDIANLYGVARHVVVAVSLVALAVCILSACARVCVCGFRIF